MPSLAFLVPGDLNTRTGGYEYDRRMVEGLRRLDWHVTTQALDGSFPQPAPPALARADAALAAIADGDLVLIDGLALGAMPEQIAAHAGRLRIVALVHHPLALETGLDPALAARLRDSERRALAPVRRVVVTSRQTLAALGEYGVPPDRIAVVEPGTDPAPVARGSGGDILRLVCVASMSPRKGHEVLFRALGALRHRAWHLVCVGSTERDPDTLQRLRKILREQQIEGRVDMVGEADARATADCYDRSDLFVLPTMYEGYGMVVAEALARGLPVISTPTGAIADLVGGEAGVLVAPGDVDGWIQALTQVFDPELRNRLAAGARRRRDRLNTWEDAARQMAEALDVHG